MKLIYIIILGTVAALLPQRTYPHAIQEKDTDANIVGHVTDLNTGEHLQCIGIMIEGTDKGCVTDATGHYRLLNLPEGTFTMKVSAMGYRTVRRQVTLTRGKTLEVNIEIEEDPIMLEGVVVSANRNETARRLAPTLVSVMGTKAFESTNSCNLAQGLAFMPGLRVENNCQNCGFQQVRINGLDGPYTQILIDSRPIFSALSGVYGLEQIPANMIERVEVMRGGGSALFGSSAIAGTINIITKEPLRNSARLSHTITGIGDGSALDNNTMLNTSLVTDDNRMGIALFAQNRQRNAYDHDGDGFTEMPELSNRTIGMRSFMKTGQHSRLKLEYHHLNEYRRGGNLLDLPPHEADVAEQTRHSINAGGISFDINTPDDRNRISIYASAQHTDRESYYGGGHDPNAYGATKDLTFILGSQYIHSFPRCIFMPADLTVGAEYTQDRLQDTQLGYDRQLLQTVRIGSIFAQNEWKDNKWSILLGGRLDMHNMLSKPVFSPRANLRFNPTPDINLRASYSFGFRAPQAFDEDLHIENVGGTVSMIRLADNLEEEKSQSISLSADIYLNRGPWQGNILVELFFTDISDVFTLTEKGQENGIIIWERGNEKGANVYGLTLEGKVAWQNKWQLQAGMTLQRATYKQERSWDDGGVAPEKRMFRTPDAYGYITTTYTPVKGLDISLSGTYTAPMLIEHHAGYLTENRTERTPHFMDLSLKASYDIRLYKGVSLQLNAGLQNIFNAYQKDFDQGPDRDSGYIYGPGMPRSFFAGARLNY